MHLIARGTRLSSPFLVSKRDANRFTKSTSQHLSFSISERRIPVSIENSIIGTMSILRYDVKVSRCSFSPDINLRLRDL